MSRSRTRITVWLAALAMALHALWPLLAQARPHAAGTLVPVCTVEGTTHYIELPAGKTPLDEQSSARHDHCAFCFFGSDRVAPPAQFQAVAPAAGEAGSPPPQAEPFTARTRSLSPGNPRAPPNAS
jgi:hypothetical protein